jgi:uncharacterized protein (TIGR02145 family)
MAIAYTELITIFPFSVRYNVTKTSGVDKKDGSISLYISGGLPPYVIYVNGNVNNGNIIGNLSSGNYDIKITDNANESFEITIPVGYETSPTYCTRFVIGRNISGTANCDEMCTGSTTNWLVYARGNSFKLGDRLYKVPNGYTSCIAGTINWSTDASWDRIKYNNNCYGVDDNGLITGVTNCGEVKVGSQYWAPENLKVTKFRDGSDIKYIANFSDFLSYKGVPAYTSYEFGESWQTRGYLYNYAAITSAKNLAPTGYRIPTKTDYDTLFGEVTSGGILKSKSTWDSPNVGAENKYNYNAVGSGFFSAGAFQQIGKKGNVWTSTDTTSNNNTKYVVSFSYDSVNVSYGSNFISTTSDDFYPVRLIKE